MENKQDESFILDPLSNLVSPWPNLLDVDLLGETKIDFTPEEARLIQANLRAYFGMDKQPVKLWDWEGIE